MSKKTKGFSLAEMLIAFVITTVLVVSTTPLMTKQNTKGEDANSIACIKNDLAKNASLDISKTACTSNPNSPCCKAIKNCKYKMGNACTTLAFYADYGKTAERNNSRKVFKETCDQGGEKACDYFAFSCKRDAEVCDISDSDNDLAYYLNLVPSDPNNGKIVMKDIVKRYYDRGCEYIKAKVDTISNSCSSCMAQSIVDSPPNSQQQIADDITQAITQIASHHGGIISGLGTSANFRDELATYMSTASTCDVVTNCFPASIKTISGSTIATPSSGDDLGLGYDGETTLGPSAGMVLTNGENLHIIYYTDCTENYNEDMTHGPNHVCANIIYDLNGSATAPNQVGDDIGFISVIGPTSKTIVSITPDSTDYTEGSTTTWALADAIAKCRAKGTGWDMPTKDELNSLYFNKSIIGNFDTSGQYSSSTCWDGEDYFWTQLFQWGDQFWGYQGSSFKVRCIKR